MVAPTAEGGHPRYVSQLLTGLGLSGHSVDATVEWIASSALPSEAHQRPLEVRRDLPELRHRAAFRSRPGWVLGRLVHYLRLERRLVQMVRSEHPDVVHLQEDVPIFGRRTINALRKRGAKVVITVHNVTAHGSPNSVVVRLRSWDLARAWRVADALVVHSPGLALALSRRLGSGGPRVHVVPHGVWTAMSQGAPSLRPVPVPHRLRMLMFGAVRSNKGYELALEVLRQLPDASLTVAGSPDDSRLSSTLDAHPAHRSGRLRLQLRFIPEDDLPDLFETHDILLLPYTDFEAQSGVLFDAIAHGIPVVVTPVGALPETVREWGLGEIAEVCTPSAVVDAVRKLCGERSYSLAIRGLAQAKRSLTWERAGAAMWGIYYSLAPESGGGRHLSRGGNESIQPGK